jgi:hypothetical protein
MKQEIIKLHLEKYLLSDLVAIVLKYGQFDCHEFHSALFKKSAQKSLFTLLESV